ncbi:glutathione-dependent formaldehyde-activating protein [Histoplasma capsulatum var. duboisii H88]|uniref:Glutathione-dependent formaldehyde-activating protein n=2 Tax=Ajellomyces capsulatus TaxID=5037 RepID=F0U6K6_AJEC8|nr:glutathione-dependent formaldehyde-activating [Histoplasma capsulatum H143]EGC40645.1 glutathione-dependent formaldehyde-activating protein [Histoplasma capsulatum var. duboisii H88]
MADKSLKSTCHCGAITVIVPHQPEEINECQCTICRRYAAAWAYYKVNEIKWEMKEGAKLSQYIWGDRDISFKFCRCYWWPFEEKKPDGGAADFGVNTRNMDPMQILHVNRRIEKAMLFQPLNDKTMAHEQDRAGY